MSCIEERNAHVAMRGSKWTSFKIRRTSLENQRTTGGISTKLRLRLSLKLIGAWSQDDVYRVGKRQIDPARSSCFEKTPSRSRAGQNEKMECSVELQYIRGSTKIQKPARQCLHLVVDLHATKDGSNSTILVSDDAKCRHRVSIGKLGTSLYSGAVEPSNTRVRLRSLHRLFGQRHWNHSGIDTGAVRIHFRCYSS